VWNRISISGQQALGGLSRAWLQAHGHAQSFGSLGKSLSALATSRCRISGLHRGQGQHRRPHLIHQQRDQERDGRGDYQLHPHLNRSSLGEAGCDLCRLTVAEKIKSANNWSAADTGNSKRHCSVRLAAQRRLTPPVHSAQLVQARLTAAGFTPPILESE